jgi:phage shock protein C
MVDRTKNLYRSRVDRKIAAVCGGLGEYFGIDPTLVRLLFVLGLIFVGGTLLAYIILAIVIPEETA